MPWRPSGVPPVSLGPRRFCVAGVGQCALPRGPACVPPVSLAWSPPRLRGRRGTMCTAKGPDVRPGVPPASLQCPLVSAAFAWQAWDNVHCQGVGCTPWRPSGVPWSPPRLRGRRGTMCTAKGPDVRPGVPPASLRCPLVSAAFAWQAWDNVHCQGAGCTPWRPSGVPWSPPRLRGRRGTMCTAKGSDVRPGVPPASLRCPLVSAAFVWQAWDNVHCQGLDARPGVPPASLRCPLVSAAFAWQAWDNVHCQGVGCTPLLLSSLVPVLVSLLFSSLVPVLASLLLSSFFPQDRGSFCSIMICWFLLVQAGVPVLVSPSSLSFGSGACLPSSLFFLSSGKGKGFCSIMIC